MNKTLQVAVFAPESTLDEEYRKIIQKRIKFSGDDVGTNIFYVEGIETLLSHNFTYALFHDDWYKNYKDQDLRALLRQFTYSYWNGGHVQNFDPEIGKIQEFLQTEKEDDVSEERFYKSLFNFSKILPA